MRSPTAAYQGAANESRGWTMSKRIWGALMAVALTAVMAASNATAAVKRGYNDGSHGFQVSSSRSNDNASVTATQAFTVIASDGSSLTVLRTCGAKGMNFPFDVIVHCYLLGQRDGLRYGEKTKTSLAEGIATVQSVLTLPNQLYTMCVRGKAWYHDGSTTSTFTTPTSGFYCI